MAAPMSVRVIMSLEVAEVGASASGAAICQTRTAEMLHGRARLPGAEAGGPLVERA